MFDGPVTTQVEVTLSWGSSVVQTLTFCPPRTVHVGDDGECPVPAERLGVPRLPLLVVAGGEVRLVVWPGTIGTVELRGRARRLDQIVAEDGALASPSFPGLLTIPLPRGSRAEIVVSRQGAQSVYRAQPSEDQLVLRVAVEEAPRRMLHRSLALRYAAAASLSLSLLAHVMVFAAEPDPVLSPTLDDEGPRDPSLGVAVTTFTAALAEPEPDGDWDRIRAPLWSGMDGQSSDIGLPCNLSTGLLPACAQTWFDSTHRRGPEAHEYAEVPRELSSCFAGPAREPDWLGPPQVEIGRAPSPAPPPRDPRLRRPVPGGELLGFLVVEDDGEPVADEVPAAPLRAARPRRPRFAFGARAAQVLARGLERAEPAFAWCYQRALQDDPRLSGHVAMRLAAPDGSGGIDAAGTDVSDPELQCCLANAQRLWTARVHGGGELRYVLDLHRTR
jgi:hypothetical protein